MTTAYVLLGSNVNAEENLRRAVALLGEQVRLRGISAVFESVPVGYREQPCFLNAILSLETDLSPTRLLKTVLRPVEAALGRMRTRNKYGPRTIDLDIILYGDRRLVCGGRRIPDPDLLSLAHVAYPMADLAPDLLHPETGETMREIAARVDSGGIHARDDIRIDVHTVETKGDR